LLVSRLIVRTRSNCCWSMVNQVSILCTWTPNPNPISGKNTLLGLLPLPAATAPTAGGLRFLVAEGCRISH
jgi:hypothetical protein